MRWLLFTLPLALGWMVPATAQVGPMPVNTATVLAAMPTGTILTLEKLPDTMPDGWVKCGYIRTEQVEELGQGHTIKDYACIRKTK